MRSGVTGGAIAIASLISLETYAHHSFNFFKSEAGDRFIVSEGTISDVRLVNPHSGVFLDVENENGEREEWTLVTRPVIYLNRRGWTQETLQVGQRVIFSGERLRMPYEAWWRAVLVPGTTSQADARLFIELEALPETEREAFATRFEGLPGCEDVSELCYRVSEDALARLRAEYGGYEFLTPGAE